MTEDEAKPYVKPIPNWIPETRTVIVVWMMVSTFIIIMSLLIWGGPKGESAQLLNTLLGMYVGTGLITSITWWMGSAKGSDTNNKMQDKMADALLPVVAPEVVSWWTRLRNDETTAIMVAGDTDARVKAFIAAAKASKATKEDLDYLVSKGLLTQDRATAIAAT